MEIIIKGTNIKLTESLKDFIEEKIRDLEKFFEFKVKENFEVKAFIEIGKLSKHHRRGDVFYAECQIFLPGKGVRSVAEKEDLKSAICDVKDELQRQLKKYKKVQIQKTTTGQRRIKKNLK
jgi:putative sigma-54 modulation protein